MRGLGFRGLHDTMLRVCKGTYYYKLGFGFVCYMIPYLGFQVEGYMILQS